MSAASPTDLQTDSKGVNLTPQNFPQLLKYLVDAGASDLHLTAGRPPVIRLHSELTPVPGLNPLTDEALRAVLYNIMRPWQRAAFEDQLELDFAHAEPNVARFRVNVFQQRASIGAVLRTIPSKIPSFDTLGLPEAVKEFTQLHRGLVLVTGATGSGKSTTLAAMIDMINESKPLHIMTIEDPIEFLHNHKRAVINQRELGLDTKSFKAALKHVLRQDPDVILVGELRDLETIQLCLTAAETGHLVFGTLHTQDAPQSVDRIIDVFPPDQQDQIRVMLSNTLQGIVCQQLIRKTDGRGRVVAAEVMVATSAIRNLIRENKTYQMFSAISSGARYGMVSMDQSLARLVREQHISMDEAKSRAHNPEDLKLH